MFEPQQGSEVRPTRRAGMKPFSTGAEGKDKFKGAIDHAFVCGLTSMTTEVVDLRCADKTVVSDHLGLELNFQVEGPRTQRSPLPTLTETRRPQS